MCLERCWFCELLEPEQRVAFASAAGIPTARGQIGEQTMQAVHGPAIGGFLGALFLARLN